SWGLLVFSGPVRPAMDAGARIQPRESPRAEKKEGHDPRLRRVRAVLRGDRVRGGAARRLHELDHPGAGSVARLPLLAGLRGDDRPRRPYVLREAHRRVGDRRRLSARLPRDHERLAVAVALSWPPGTGVSCDGSRPAGWS